LAPETEPHVAYLGLGSGLAEIGHLDVGAYVHPRVTVDVTFGYAVFNPLAGIGASAYLLGEIEGERTPRHTLVVHARARLNTEIWPPRVRSRGSEEIASTAELYLGYAAHRPSGFVFKGLMGVIFYRDFELQAGPNTTVMVGYAF